MIIYQIYPRSYQDSNGDGIGDLPGITKRLPHIASLGGVDYVWISPFFSSPMKDFGYDVSDYRTVDPLFGTNEDFDILLAEAHRLGLKIMVDFVLAHTSNQHSWFQESRRDRTNSKADWYVWADPRPDGTAPNNWLSVFGGPAWHWDAMRQQYYLTHFLPEQPALNWYSQEVEAEMLDTVEYWLRKGVRGFRLDAVMHAHHDPALKDNPSDPDALIEQRKDPYQYQKHLYNVGQPGSLQVMKKLRALTNKYSDALLLGEIGEREVARRYTGSDLLHTTYFFDFLKLEEFNAQEINQQIEKIFADFPQGDFFWALSNHDFARHLSRLNPEPTLRKEFAKLTTALFLSLPGGYCLYQGEEFGFPTAELRFEDLVDPFDRFLWPFGQRRDTARTPIPWESREVQGGFTTSTTPWLPVDRRQLSLALDVQEEDQKSVLNYYRKVIAWRKEFLTSQNKAKILKLPDTFVGFEVYHQGKNDPGFLCFFNLSSLPQELRGYGELEALPLSEGVLEENGTLRFQGYGIGIFRSK